MILLIDTSANVFKIGIVDNIGKHHYAEIETNRDLAKNIQKIIATKLDDIDAGLKDISGIVIFEGPGSFTGLRIGISVANSLAKALQIPIVGTGGDEWIESGLKMLDSGVDERIVIPNYGSEAKVTNPKK